MKNNTQSSVSNRGRVRVLAFVAGRALPVVAFAALNAAAVAQPATDAPAAQPKMSVPPPQPAGDGGQRQGAKLGEKGTVKVSDQMTVDLSVKDENITTVLELLAVQSRKNILASKSVGGRISADLFGVTFFEALDAILKVNGFAYIREGNFIYVMTVQEFIERERAMKPRVAKVIRLNYLTAPDAQEFVRPMLSQGGEIKTNAKTESFSISDSSPAGKDDFALGSTMVVIDYEENISAIEKLLIELDTKPAQVLVEATVLSTRVTDDTALGVDFSIIGDLRFQDFATQALGGPFGIVNALRDQKQPVGNGVNISSPVGGTDEPGGFKIGIVQDNVALFVRMLDQVSDTSVLANPKILALNRQPSRVLVGERVGYLSTTATETSTTQTVQFLDTGVQLYFRPFVNAARTEVRMELKPQFSQANPTRIPGANGAQIIIPNEVTQELVTNVIVPDGMTVVLGGLFREDVASSRNQVPFIGDIPIIGLPFRGQSNAIDRTEIIFLLTPNIVTDAALADQGKAGDETIDRVRSGSRQGLLPWTRDRMTAQLNVEAEHAARGGDTQTALWKLQRSLQLNPNQPEALRLRERLTGEREVWPSRSLFHDIVDKEVSSRLNALPQGVSGSQPHLTPWGSVDLPREKVGGKSGASASPVPAPTPAPDGAPPAAAAVVPSAEAEPEPVWSFATDGSPEQAAADTPAQAAGFVAGTPVNPGTPVAGAKPE